MAVAASTVPTTEGDDAVHDVKKRRVDDGSSAGNEAPAPAAASNGGHEGQPVSGVGALRQAMATSGVEEVLCEIRHFLQHDQRLPDRTRYAVQFFDGLRQQMIIAKKDETSPEYFRDPFEASDIQQYTFREVRSKLGDGFRERFWPMFQMYHACIPVHAPEAEAPDALHTFLGKNR